MGPKNIKNFSVFDVHPRPLRASSRNDEANKHTPIMFATMNPNMYMSYP